MSLLQPGPFGVSAPNVDSPRGAAESPRLGSSGREATCGSVGGRILTRQVESLDGDLLSGFANIPAVAVTAFVMRKSISAGWLYLWIAIAAGAILLLIVAVRGPLPWRNDRGWPKGGLRARLVTHVFLTTLVGGVWGGACLAFGPSLPQFQMMFLTVIILGCNAACISALGPYLPAFFGYYVSSLAPLAYVNLIRPEPEATSLAWLVLIYMATIAINVRSYNRSVLNAFRLQSENEALAENVVRANAATAAETRSKWNTLAHLSHELRTPMNAIIGFSEVMREQMFGPIGERYLGYSGHIHDSGRHAIDLIDAILEVSSAESGHVSLTEGETTPLLLVAECLRMVEIAATAKHLTLESRFGQSMPRVAGDLGKLRQALLNLLTNAIKYTPNGGHVSVTTLTVDDGLDIAVTDTGVGIAAEDMDRCVEPFVRLRNPDTAGVEGVGLGLPLAKHMVELHGGSLRIASELGHGTVVTIHMPSERCLAA